MSTVSISINKKKKIITEMRATVRMVRRRAKGVEAMVVVPRMGGRGSTRVVLEAWRPQVAASSMPPMGSHEP